MKPSVISDNTLFIPGSQVCGIESYGPAVNPSFTGIFRLSVKLSNPGTATILGGGGTLPVGCYRLGPTV
jgi:hypothetical protein